MATRIRTINFLPEIFQTQTNTQFLAATLDQLVDQPNTEKIQGYIGSKFGYSINAKDYYVTEPTKVRTDYQVEPGVVFTKQNDVVAQDFISYPGIVDSIENEGGLTDNHNRLFESEIYAWDSFTNLDTLVNFNQYYWLPEGPERVTVGQADVTRLENYVVGDFANYYTLSPLGFDSTESNPTITLLRGGTYTFSVNQNSKFWIQGSPGITGMDPLQPNMSTRDIYGVTNNGIEQGTVIFQVPFRDAQNQYLLPGDNKVDLVCNIPFAQLNGTTVNDFTGIDGITAVEGLTVMFYDTGYPEEIGFVSTFFNSEDGYDVNSNLVPTLTITATSTNGTTNAITCDSTSNMSVGTSITFSGLPFGNINQYTTGLPLTYSTSSINIGSMYYIDTVGTTDWISIGLPASGEVLGYISTNILFVSNLIGGSIDIGQTLFGTGVTSGTKVVSQLSNIIFDGYIDDGAGNAGNILTVTNIDPNVALGVGLTLVGLDIPFGLTITALISGSGGVGTYQVSSSIKISPTSLVANAQSGVSIYYVDTNQNTVSTNIFTYDIEPGRIFTATGTDPGTGLVINYSPVIYYVSEILNSTQFKIASELNNYVVASYLEIGKTYSISFLGTTNWNQVAGTTGVVYTVGSIIVPVQTGSGSGSATELVVAGNFEYGRIYEITTSGTTDFTLIGAINNNPGTIFVATGAGSGTGTALPYVEVDLSTATGLMTGYINQGLYEEGYYSNTNQNIYRINFIGPVGNQVISLSPVSLIPNNQKITANYGTQYINRSFFRSNLGIITIIPYLSALLDTLYYQDGTNPNKVGTIKLIENVSVNTLNVERDIIGKKTYTSSNGVVFTNGLKITFQGRTYPIEYENNDYYVEGVGTAIELIPVSELITPEPFTGSILIPWDTTGYDSTNYEGNSFIPVYQDYITIARNSVNKNAWSRSNRWFHIGVIQATAQYNNNPNLLNLYATEENKAKRPIIEFYPNLKLFNSGIISKAPVDFIDFRTTDAFSLVAGQEVYYPDVEVYTEYTATIESTDYTDERTATSTDGTTEQITCDSTTGFRKNDTIVFDNAILDPVFGGIQAGVTYYISEVVSPTVFTMSETYDGPVVNLTTGSSTGTRFFWSPRGTNIIVDTADITLGAFQVAQYVADSTNLLPKNTYITNISQVGTTLTLTVYWGSSVIYQAGTTVASLAACPTPMGNFAVFDGARIVFAADTNENVKNKIYVVRFSSLTPFSTPTITLSEASDGEILPNVQVVAFRGYNYQGMDFYFDGENWIEGQQKTLVNQPPLFDVFDENNISFGDKTVYSGSSFNGCKLFSYGIGSGLNDTILGIPLRFSSVSNSNDISFDVNINSDTFTYVEGSIPITKQVNTGFVFCYEDYFSPPIREIGWQTCVSPSAQYQLFSFNFDITTSSNVFVCDIAANLETNWPVVLVYNNNNLISKNDYTINIGTNTTTITLDNSPTENTVIQVLILSTQVSNNAFYTIPLNLSNNPLNENITTVNVGELRLHYQSICVNNDEITGTTFGNNNFRDLGNLVPWATQIIQNSASLVLLGAMLRKSDHNLFNALYYNNIEYIKYKTLLVSTADQTIVQQTFNPAMMLDQVLDVITSSKTSTQSFFWSDMLPNKAVFITNTYTFANSLDVSVYPLSRVYSFIEANYYGVLVYLNRIINNNRVTIQLIKDVDYTVSATTPSLTITFDLLPNDQVTIKEYNQTYGSYVPNTPTKLGLYPKFIPAIILDSDYATPTYFIRGHDGSYNKLYGDYDPNTGVLIDFRDQVLFEFEKRIYNNLKCDAAIPINEYEIEPGFFRDTQYSLEEFIDIYSKTFLDWVGQNRVNYKTQLYNNSNQLTYNYFESGNKINKEPIYQGYWRGLYNYYYDTFNPNLAPWQMIGYSDQPSWWTGRYGPAPYTSDNTVLWSDLAAGIDWNNGNPVVVPWAVRPELLRVLPVDSAGNLVSPLVSIVGNYVSTTFQRDWKIGDISPTELSYRRSSSWPFDLMRILALMKPAKFYNLGVDLDVYRYNTEFNQYLVNGRSHLTMSDIQVYGSGTPVTSYINWIVDYEKQIGLDATTNITNMLKTLDVRLVYRVAGFTDKTLLKFYVEKGSPNNRSSSLLIPDESYQILLYDNQPFDKIAYSGIIIQLTENGGFAVYGNNQSRPVFVGLEPIKNGNVKNLTVENLTVKLPLDYSSKEKIIPYGTIFYTISEVSLFIKSVGAKYLSQGMTFETLENEIEVNWDQMVAEFLYYAQTGWEPGTLVTLNPAAKNLTINKDGYIVQPLTIQNTNFILNDNLYPIGLQDINIVRDQTLFSAIPLSTGDAIGFGQFNINNIEHGIVFNNLTLFDDVIYNLVTGLRQQRIIVAGWRTAEWNGTITAQGFILNQDNITEWSKEVKYTKGSIVKYKNKYWTALKIVQPGFLFNEQEWKQTDYDTIQKGLLPNPSTRSYESTIYYDTNKANLENDGDLLGFSLIGYRPREYMSLADLSDITQINVYKNIIKQKGTPAAANVFKGANLPQGGIKYDVYENWAIKSGEFGGVLNSNFVQIRLNEKYLTGNPGIVSLTDGLTYTSDAQQQVPLTSVFNYGRMLTDANILPTTTELNISKIFPDSGYVNFNDVKMSTYYYTNMSNATDQQGIVIPITELLVRDYVWVANYKEQWQVLTPKPLGQVIFAKNNLNNTVTVVFSKPHNLTQYQTFAIVNFNSNVDGYYIANLIPNPTTVIINLVLNPGIKTVTGLGVAMQFQNQRVATPADINTLPLLDSEFIKNTVWVDTNNDGNWAVYRKSINYVFENEITKAASDTFGSAVAFSTDIGYLIGDAEKGEVYRYSFNALNNAYALVQTITEGASFGSNITIVDDLVVITEPSTLKWRVYQHVTNGEVDILVEIQEVTSNYCASIAMSGDQNWLYIGNTNGRWVYVRHKTETQVKAGSFVIGKVYTIQTVGDTDFTAIGAVNNNVGTVFIASGIGTGTGIATTITYSFVQNYSLSAPAGSDFAYSLSTNYDGSLLLIGAPEEDYNLTTVNWGKVYLANRLVQTIEANYTSIPTVLPGVYELAWTVTPHAARTGSSVNGATITCSGSMTGFANDSPVIFQGVNGTTNDFKNSGIIPNKVYYIFSTSGSTLQIKENLLDTTPITFTASPVTGLSFNIYVQSQVLDVSVNGSLVDNSNYGIIGSNFVYTSQINAGDIITVSGAKFVQGQSLTSPNTPRIGVEYGTSVDNNRYGNEILVGAPFEISTGNIEGAVYRYTNGGASYGTIIGTNNCNVTTSRKLMINGYLLLLSAGNAAHIANLINTSGITNVQASASDGKLIVSLLNSNLGIANQKLILTSDESSTITELGIESYQLTQTILCPHTFGPTQFGSVVKFNEYNSFVASAPAGTRYAATTFDFVDNENDDDTVFDNNTTQFIDNFKNAGAVYMFDYLGQYNESLDNIGQYVYAQSVNDNSENYGAQPMYGQALDFNSNKVLIGTPKFKPNVTNGQVIVYENNTSNQQDWSVFRSSSPVVDISKISTIQIFDLTTNNTLINLDYIDPLQGKILGAARENIDFISNADPARYNTDNTVTVSQSSWGAEFVGSIWFDTSTTKFVNYHQDNLIYNTKYWGTVFPGSEVAVYSWIESPLLPINYIGPGTVYDTTRYATQYMVNQSGALVPMYYYWVKNTNIIFTKAGKTLADSIVSSYIANPSSSGISYFTPLLPNTFGLYNSAMYIQALNSVLSLNFATGTTDDITHNAFDLIRANYADDYLPGLPTFNSTNKNPESLYAKLLDSLSGTDIFGNVVPNPFLPKAVQTGILNRPKQSFFLDRLGALKNYVQFVNEMLSTGPFTEFLNSEFLQTTGEFFNTPDYWEYVNWWAPGYSDATKPAIQVTFYADLSTLDVDYGTIVTVAANGTYGLPETYIFTETAGWVRIGVTNGTYRIKSSIYDYANNGIGFGNNFYDTDAFDVYPSEETRYIVRALTEELPQNYLIDRNKLLILLFEYIQTESIQSQNYLSWLTKTSLVDVSHVIRELLPYQTYKSDNQEFLAGYINEVKPYHVVIKDFLFKYTGVDVFEGDITDFDLPSQFNTTYQNFISPQLVYENVSNEYQYLPTSSIWENNLYSQWFQNYGLSLGGQDSYLICSLETYIALNSSFFFVDNSSGLPSTGTLLINEEKIGYTEVDRVLNIVSGLVRGVDNTLIQTHVPGSPIFIDLPGVVVLDKGRGYTSVPRVIAYIDPTKYPLPRKNAILEPVVAGGEIIAINIIDSGSGYVVTPTIIIDPAITVEFNSTDVNVTFNTITINDPILVTGDIIQYKTNIGSTEIQGLVDNQWYYVNVLEDYPLTVISLYESYNDAINDQNRIQFANAGNGTHTINEGARANAIVQSVPTRENILSLKYDRTSYNPSVIVWRPGEYYGAYYAGLYNNTLTTSSSSIKLQSTQPPISAILASAQGVSFEIVSVTNEQTLDWSSFERDVSILFVDGTVKLIPKAFSFIGQGSIAGNIFTITSLSSGEISIETYLYSNPEVYITQQLSGTTGGIGTYELSQNLGTVSLGEVKGFMDNTSGTTIGMVPGMPVQFVGITGNSGVSNTSIYYVSEVLNSLEFTIATDPTTLTPITFSNTYTVTAIGLKLLISEVINKAVLTVYYPGITNVTNTTFGTNAITIPLNLTGTGGTNNFYIGMPVFFTGEVFGGIIENDVYYINGIIDLQNFTVSSTNDAYIKSITETIASTDTIILDVTNDNFSINEPIIFSNFVISGSPSNTFGNLVSGQTYYVVGQVGTNEIQVSTTVNGSVLSLSDETGTGNIISQKNAVQLTTASGSMTININLPVSPGQINGQLFTLYQTSSQYTNQTGTTGDLIEQTITATLATVNRITFLSTEGGLDNLYVNMPLLIGTNIVGAQFTGSLAANVLTVTSISSGTITTSDALIVGPNITLPARITAQLTGPTGGVGTYTIDSSETSLSGSITSYTLDIDTTYYVTDLGTTKLIIGSTTNVVQATFTGVQSGFVLNVLVITGYISVGATITLGINVLGKVEAQLTGTPGGTGTYQLDTSDIVLGSMVSSVGVVTSTESNATDRLYVGMPVTFGGTGTGGININQEYYVAYIHNGTQFALSNIKDGAVISISNATGSMIAYGEPYITVSNTIGGSDIELLDKVDTNTFSQYPLTVPEFDVSYIMGGYRVIITNPGSGFAVNNTITISGIAFGGTSKNNLTLTVNEIDVISYDPINDILTSNGEITSVICAGIVPGSNNQYYLKVISPTELEIYSNPLMTVPVSGLDLPYTGIIYTTVVSTTASNDIELNDVTGFNLYDPVVFTGNVDGGLVLGTTYYIYTIDELNDVITVTTVPGDVTTLVTVTTTTTTFTVAKSGDFAVLPEPFYFNQSVVKYDNQIWLCVISNNDEDFVIGKWQLLDSGSKRLNALDRIIGYYQPTDNMPGVNIEELVSGTRYPNSTYLGNRFQPDQQFPLDTILSSTTFYPTQLNFVGVANRKSQGLIGVLNTNDYSGFAVTSFSTGSVMNWEVFKLNNFNMNLTSIIKTVSNKYIITSANYPNNIIVGSSIDAFENTLTFKSIPTPSTIINSVVENNGLLVAVGDTIIVSTDDGQNWIKVYELSTDPRLTFNLKSVTYVSTTLFTGYVAVGIGQFLDFSSGLTEIIDGNAVFVSNNGINWQKVEPFTYNYFNSVSFNGTNIVAVGQNNVIYYSIDGVNWSGVTETNVLTTNTVTNSVNVLDTGIFSVDDKLLFLGTPFGGLQNNVYYYVASINSTTSSITLSLSPGGVSPVTVTTASPVNLSLFSKILEDITLPNVQVNINSVYYSSDFNIYIAVGDSGYIFESTNGISWPSITQFDIGDNNLFAIAESIVDGLPYVAVLGSNNNVLTSTQPTVSWDQPQTNFTRPEQTYNIQGESFTNGYGPEELVPGVISDNITMLVATRPGTNWESTIYQHVGYRVVSKEVSPITFPQFEYSFANICQALSQIRISKITRDITDFYSLSETSLYDGIDYTTNWITKTITLNTSLALNELLRIDVYEVGNGDQLVKSNSDTDPIRYNQDYEWYEIYLNCNYSATIFNGSGVIQPGSEPKQVLAIKTDAETDTITCVSVKDFILNDPITFQGGVFGNIQEDVTYYVKTISYASNSISISDTFNPVTSTAGPTLNLTDATGEMYAIIQVGSGTTYATPLVYANGYRLSPGITSVVTKSQSNNNTLTCNSTVGMTVGSTIVFSSSMFGNIQGGILESNLIQSGQTYRINSIGTTDFTLIGAISNTVGDFFVATGTGSGTGTVTAVYYIKTIFDSNQFTISSTNGGATKTLADANGGAYLITNDFSFGLQPNGQDATLLFAYPYDSQQDYLAYTVFGETQPIQYGGTIPEIQLYTGNGSTLVFTMDNYNGGSNPNNAIVEVNGLRVLPSDYVISDLLNTITFTVAPTGTVAVTTFNLTERQYFSTNTWTFGGTPEATTVSAITNVINAISPPIAQAFVDTTDGTTQYITCATGSDTNGFIVGQYIQFFGTGFGGILTDGTVYEITNVVDISNFEINTVLTPGISTGTMSAVVGGQDTTRITTSGNHNLNTNDLVRIDGLLGSTQLNNNLYYVHILSNTQFDVYAFDPDNPTKDYSPTGSNNVVTQISSYSGGGFVWLDQSFILQTTNVTATSSSSNKLTVTDASQLIAGTPVVFMEYGVLIGNTTMGGLVTGQTYYIKQVFLDDNQFTISETRDGATFSLITDSGSILVAQWEQYDTDRLWVTVNGYRIPSSSLRINPGNNISILDKVSPSDDVIITSMIPSATPDEETFLINVNQINQPVVYSVNYNRRTWITEDLEITNNSIQVYNASYLVNTITQSTNAPSPVNGYYYIGLTANRNLITGITLTDLTTNTVISSNYYSIQILGLVPTLVVSINSGINTGDELGLLIYEGNLVYINGEQIQFTNIDLENNIISGLNRGLNGTGAQSLIAKNTEIYGLTPNNRMTNTQYNETWNPIPGVFNVTQGDPLQIADTQAADFLKPNPTGD